MNSFNEIFLAAKEYCKRNTVAQSYELFIEPLKEAVMNDDSIIIYAPDEFRKGIAETRFTELWMKAFEEVLGFTVPVIFEKKDEFDYVPSSGVKKGDYEYTFDTFIVGSSNRFAHAAALAVSKNPADAYNPLFIYGASGLGKTHLLHAIRTEIKKNHPEFNIIYVSGETFTNEIIQAIKDKTTDELKTKYRKADVLLVDDIQFIAGKETTQEEFFHTFNALHTAHKQIVLVSDRQPKEMKSLEERLRTRFEWGLMADIQTPDYETRCAIIKRKAEALDLELKNEVVEFIASKVQANIRQLEGVVKKLDALKNLQGAVPNLVTARAAIGDILSAQLATPVTIDKIISETARVYNCSSDEIRGKGRKREIAEARKMAMYIIKEVCGLTMKEIGREFSDRDHSTVVYSISEVEKTMKSDPSYKDTVEDIIKNIKTL